MRTPASVILLVSVLVACSGLPQAPSPPVGDRSAAVSPPASGEPPASQAVSTPPTAAPPEAFEWGEPVPMSGMDVFSLYRPEFVHARGAFVVADDSQMWASPDARSWSAVDLPFDVNADTEIRDLVAGDLGFFAVGEESIDADDDGSPEDSRAIVLTSNDGQDWRRLEDPRFEHAAMNFVALSAQGVIAFGQSRNGASIWTSPDGRDWLKTTNETGLQVAAGVQLVAESGGRLVAFVALAGPTDDESGPVEVWQTEGRAEWERVGRLPDAADVYVHRAAFGGGRWVAIGSGLSTDGWSSVDGVAWHESPSPGGGGVNAIVGWAGGLIAAGATGSEPGETCGGSEPYVGRSWLAIAGSDWVALPPTEGSAIKAMVVVEDQVVAIGQTIVAAGGGVDPIVWTARLPASPAPPIPEASPAPTATPGDGPEGCGP